MLKWSSIAQTMLEHLPGAPDEKAEKVAELMNDMDRSQFNRMITGKRGAKIVGVRSDTVFEFGEAVRAAGVKWSSGLLMLAMTEPYRVHAFGIVGEMLRACDASKQKGDSVRDLRAMWHNLFRVLSTNAANLEITLSQKPDLKLLTLTEDQARIVNKSWVKWQSTEDTHGMPDTFSGFIAMSKINSANRVTAEFFSAKVGVERSVFEWMRRVHYQWKSFATGFTAKTDLETESLLSYRGSIEE